MVKTQSNNRTQANIKANSKGRSIGNIPNIPTPENFSHLAKEGWVSQKVSVASTRIIPQHGNMPFF